MKKINYLVAIFAAVASLTFVSCNNDSGDDSETPQSGNDYWPTAVNNVWHYEDADHNPIETKIVSTQSIDGKTYYKFEPQSANGVSNNNFLRKINGAYYLRTSEATIDFGGLTGTQTGFEFIVLKDNVAVDGTWSGSYDQTTNYTGYPAIEQSTNYTGTILAKDVTETVNGVTYTNIIKLNIYQETSSSGSLSIANTEYWFAKDVGLIWSKIYTGSGISTSTLVNYTLF
ncbi:MAG: hypothetical protein V4548_01240 [Bacteroidota bacterium]